MLYKEEVSMAALMYTCSGTFYNLFLGWEETAGLVFLGFVLFLISCSHIMLALHATNTANSHCNAHYTIAWAV